MGEEGQAVVITWETRGTLMEMNMSLWINTATLSL